MVGEAIRYNHIDMRHLQLVGMLIEGQKTVHPCKTTQYLYKTGSLNCVHRNNIRLHGEILHDKQSTNVKCSTFSFSIVMY